MISILFPNINPIILKVGPFAIKWYGLAYVIGIILCLYFIEYVSKNNAFYKNFNKKQIDALSLYCIVGIILGGRLGYVLFYRPEWFIERPLMVLNTLEGGMSFHGALIGITLSILIFSLKNKIPFLCITDLIATIVPIGIFFGRIANFINAELYGRITNVSWAVIFPYSDGMPRHPSQIYEAFTEGLVLLAVMMYCFFKLKLFKKNGVLTGIFLIGYAIARVSMENFREADLNIGYLIINLFGNSIAITKGQILTIPMLVYGILLLVKKRDNITSSV